MLLHGDKAQFHYTKWEARRTEEFTQGPYGQEMVKGMEGNGLKKYLKEKSLIVILVLKHPRLPWSREGYSLGLHGFSLGEAAPWNETPNLCLSSTHYANLQQLATTIQNSLVD